MISTLPAHLQVTVTKGVWTKCLLEISAIYCFCNFVLLHCKHWRWTLQYFEIISYLSPGWLTHRVISDKVLCLFVTLSYFRPDRVVQLLSLIPILILLLYLLVSIYLVYTGICELDIKNYLAGEQLSSKLHLFRSVTETMNSFSVTNNC